MRALCDALPALDAARFAALTEAQRGLDHRSSGTVALIAYAAAGTLPASESRPHSRESVKRHGAKADLSIPAAIEPTLRCAVCRLVAQELSLAAELTGRCAPASRGLSIRSPNADASE